MTLRTQASDGQVRTNMATVKFDMRDPETKATVEGWTDNTEYTIRTGMGPRRALAEVVEAPEEPEPESEDAGMEMEHEMPPPSPSSSAGATAVKKAMGATR